ncbi:hypothetical protein GCM10009596_27290 [Arthrobacter rhombi]
MDLAHAGVGVEQEGQFLDGGQLIICDDDIDHATSLGSDVSPGTQAGGPASYPGWNLGIRSVISVPAPGAVSMTRPWPSP